MTTAWPGSGADPQREHLFAAEVPSVPATTPSVPYVPQGGLAPEPSLYLGDQNTLDEPVWATIKRDVFTIGRNLRAVLIPVNWKFDKQTSALRNWDLWGPMIFQLALAIILSWGESKPSEVFALVFTEVALGAVILTVNVMVLGGEIVFFQSLCLLGYCLFPIVIAAIVCSSVSLRLIWVRTLVLLLALVWSCLATVPFIGQSVPEKRRLLAVYPVLLLYSSIGWVALVKK